MEKTTAGDTCRSIFRDGKEGPSAKEYTRIWISLIDRFEKERGRYAPEEETRGIRKEDRLLGDAGAHEGG